MKKLLTTCVVAAGLLMPPAFTTTVQAEPPPGRERHPEIRQALRALENAKNRLQHADHDFGGHREAALRSCNEAIEQLQLALKFDQ